MKEFNVYMGVYCNTEYYRGTLRAKTEEDAEEMAWEMACEEYDSYESYDEENSEFDYASEVESVVSYYLVETKNDTNLEEEITYLN